MLKSYASHGSYFRHSTGQPLASTFEGDEQVGDWERIKAETSAFFIPDYSSLGAKRAMDKASGIADGLFSE